MADGSDDDWLYEDAEDEEAGIMGMGAAVFDSDSDDEAVADSRDAWKQRAKKCEDDGGVSDVAAGEEESKKELERVEGYISEAVGQLFVLEEKRAGIGFQLWRTATNALCGHLEEENSAGRLSLKGKRVLELGAGCGVVGMLAAELGGDVVVTDLQDVVPHMAACLQCNGRDSWGAVVHSAVDLGGEVEEGRCVAAALCWGDEEALVAFPAGSFDVVLLSDVVYNESLYEPLLATLRHLLKGSGSDTVIRMSQCPRRTHVEKRFFKGLRRFAEVEQLSEARPGGTRRGLVRVFDIRALRKE